MGAARNSIAKDISLRKLIWSDGPLNILGVIITKANKMEEANIDPMLENAEILLNLWKHRNLSIMGAILICNALIASLFYYRLAVLPPLSKARLDRYNAMIRDFIWQGKKAKFALATLQANKEDGGLGLCNLKVKELALNFNGSSNCPKINCSQP